MCWNRYRGIQAIKPGHRGQELGDMMHHPVLSDITSGFKDGCFAWDGQRQKIYFCVGYCMYATFASSCTQR